MSEKPYDSTADTLAHIRRVQELLAEVIAALQRRMIVHDKSKLESPEKECFDEVTPKLKGLTYGSEEYRATLSAMKPALDHHYAVNRHHPEYFSPIGINGMTLIDLIEMLADWRAAVERHADGSMKKSLAINRDRFAIGHQLQGIIENTIKGLYWDIPAQPDAKTAYNPHE